MSWKTLDRIVSAIIRRLFKPKDHVERVERYQLPGRLRIVKWCAAPADAPEDELRPLTTGCKRQWQLTLSFGGRATIRPFGSIRPLRI